MIFYQMKLTDNIFSKIIKKYANINDNDYKKILRNKIHNEAFNLLQKKFSIAPLINKIMSFNFLNIEITILISMTDYYNNKYKSNIENIKYDILKRINIYSLGISLLYILGEKINEKSDFDLKLLLEITILCLLSIFEFNGNFYYNDIDINEIYKKYESMISLHHDSIEIMSKSSSDDSLFPELNTSGNK